MTSYHKINYDLRSAKSIERKLIFEAIRELIALEQLKKYRYIGFGSPFYTDFRIVHKELGINSLICIEGEKDDKERFDFNKPYKCIDLIMEHSTSALLQINWSEFNHHIIWLDYDGSLQKYMFEDLSIIILKVKPGSFILITCNATLNTYKGSQDVPNIEQFKTDFDGYVPLQLTPRDLHNANASKTIRNMFIDLITREIESLNGPLEKAQRCEFIQLFNFCYQDNSKMLTFGGIISSVNDKKNIISKPIIASGALQNNESTIEIIAPIITNKEIDLMNRFLPSEETEFMECNEIKFIPKEFRRTFYKYYRQFPNFMEVR